MALKAKTKPKLNHHHVRAVPFYKLHYSFDELPLDPVKPFILEKIRK